MNDGDPTYKKTRKFMSLTLVHKMLESGYIEQIDILIKPIVITPIHFTIIQKKIDSKPIILEPIIKPNILEPIIKPIILEPIIKPIILEPIIKPVEETKVFEPIFKETSKYKMVTRTIVRPPLSIQDFIDNKKLKYDLYYLRRLQTATHYMHTIRCMYPKLGARLSQDIVSYVGDEKYTTISIKVKKSNMKNEGRYNLLVNYVNPIIDEPSIATFDEIRGLLDVTYRDPYYVIITDEMSKPCCSKIKKNNHNKYSERYRLELLARNKHIKRIANDYEERMISKTVVDKILKCLDEPLKPISEDDLKYRIEHIIKFNKYWMYDMKIIPNNLSGEINEHDITQKIHDFIQTNIADYLLIY
jgi:hypothetical protein